MTTRPRRGQHLMPGTSLYRLEEEHSLELPLGYLTSAAPARVAVMLHAFHTGLLPEFRAYLEHIPFPADLFVSTDTEEKRATAAACFAGWAKGSVEVRVVPNRGRDIAPKLVGFAAVHDSYEYVLHLHTKSSPHDSRLVGWRGYLLDTLLGSPGVVHGVFEAFARAPRLGMVAPQHIDELRPWIRWGENHRQAHDLAARMGFPLPRAAPLDFPSGSMFWARTAALRPLLDLHLGFGDFPIEAGQTDGTLAHAIERLYFLVCEHAGFDWLKVTARGELHDQQGVTAVAAAQELDRFLARHRLRLTSLRGVARLVGDAPVITSPPPKPRRVLHVTWRAALGDVVPPPGHRLVVALHGAASEPATLRSVEVALRLLPAGIRGQVLALPGASRGVAQQAGFAEGADLVLLVGTPGLLHPQAASALLRMSNAHGGRVLMEAASIPGRGHRPVDGQDFGLSWVTGPAIAVPRSLHDAIGTPDERLGTEMADQGYSQRARAQGYDVLLCPQALFYAVPPRSDGGGSSRRMEHAPGIDVVTRLYDLADLPHLDRLVFSIMGQPAVTPLHLHVMLQRFSFAETQKVRETMYDLRRLRNGTSVTLHNWDNPAPFDLRVPLLNWGLEVAQGRYFTCLDVQEQLCPHGCSALLARLQCTEAALALGGTAAQPVVWWGDVVLPVPDRDGGPSSVPFFLADRDRLTREDLVFRTGEPDGEIKELIERLSQRHAVDEACRDDVLVRRMCPL